MIERYRNLEERILELDALLRVAKENAAIGIWEFDFKTGKLSFSKEAFQISKIRPDEFDGKLSSLANKIVRSDFRGSVESAIYAAIKEQRIEIMEYPLSDETGGTTWVSVNGVFNYDEYGLPVKISGIVQDITSIKLYEDALETDSEFLDTLINIIHNPIFFKDTNGIYRFCNSAFSKFVGLEKSEVNGSTVYDIAPKELADIYHRSDLELFDKRGHQAYESKVQRSDGQVRDVIFVKSILEDRSGNAQGLIGIILDVTSQNALRAHVDYMGFMKDAIIGLNKHMDGFKDVLELFQSLMIRMISFMDSVSHGCLFEVIDEDKVRHIATNSNRIPDKPCSMKLVLNLQLLKKNLSEDSSYVIQVENQTDNSDSFKAYASMFGLEENGRPKLILPLINNSVLAHIIVLEGYANTDFTEKDLVLANYILEQMPLLYQVYTLSRKSKDLVKND